MKLNLDKIDILKFLQHRQDPQCPTESHNVSDAVGCKLGWMFDKSEFTSTVATEQVNINRDKRSMSKIFMSTHDFWPLGIYVKSQKGHTCRQYQTGGINFKTQTTSKQKNL